MAGKLGDTWKLHLASPPLDGKANEECVRFLAGLAGVSRAQVRIIAGANSRTKVVEVDGVAQEDLEARLTLAVKTTGKS